MRHALLLQEMGICLQNIFEYQFFANYRIQLQVLDFFLLLYMDQAHQYTYQEHDWYDVSPANDRLQLNFYLLLVLSLLLDLQRIFHYQLFLQTRYKEPPQKSLVPSEQIVFLFFEFSMQNLQLFSDLLFLELHILQSHSFPIIHLLYL